MLSHGDFLTPCDSNKVKEKKSKKKKKKFIECIEFFYIYNPCCPEHTQNANMAQVAHIYVNQD